MLKITWESAEDGVRRPLLDVYPSGAILGVGDGLARMSAGTGVPPGCLVAPGGHDGRGSPPRWAKPGGGPVATTMAPGAWTEVQANEASDAIVAAMGLAGVEYLFFTSGSEIMFYQEAVAKAQAKGLPAPKIITMT